MACKVINNEAECFLKISIHIYQSTLLNVTEDLNFISIAVRASGPE